MSAQPVKSQKVIGSPTLEAQEQVLSKLKKIQPHAVIFSSSELSLCQSSQQDSSTSAAAQKGTIRKLHVPPPLTSLHRRKYEQLSKEAISTLCAEVFAKGVIAMSADEAMYLEECTRLSHSCCGLNTALAALQHQSFCVLARHLSHPPHCHLWS